MVVGVNTEEARQVGEDNAANHDGHGAHLVGVVDVEHQDTQARGDGAQHHGTRQVDGCRG